MSIRLPSSYMEPKIFDNKYVVKQQLSSGSFGIVYLAIHKVTREELAVKLEKGDHETLDREVYLLTKLQGIMGVPKLFWFGFEQNYNVMVIELLGRDLGYYQRVYKQLSIKSGLQLLTQLIQIFKQVHSKGVVHRDLKPENIMMGKHNTSQVFLVDFGVSKQFLEKGKHIPFKDKKSFIGTTRYASIAAHKGYEIGRKDDLESLLYVIIYLTLGKLPWQNLQNIGDRDRTIVVGEVKIQTPTAQLCKDLPIQFTEILNYVKSLPFDAEPDYELIKALLKKGDVVQDNMFEWSDRQIQNTPSSFLAVPELQQQRKDTKRTSNISQLSQSTNVVRYLPSQQEVVKAPEMKQEIKLVASQPHIDLKKVQTIEFDEIDENLQNQPTLEQKLMKLQCGDFKFKDEQRMSHSSINIFE
ncbi:hypothetical protein pb186bvf_016306 [Paramecium bursaria]